MKYNHALTLAYQVISDNPEMPSLDEAWHALQARMASLAADVDERREALLSEVPFDTFEIAD
jgi:hypothetical protein